MYYWASWSSWSVWISRGENESNMNECWKLAQVGGFVGIYWDSLSGFCRELVEYQSLLPWPNSFPYSQNQTMYIQTICIKTSLIGTN